MNLEILICQDKRPMKFFFTIKKNLKKCIKDEKGASVIEYALLVGCVTLVIIVASTKLGEKAKSYIEGVSSKISNQMLGD